MFYLVRALPLGDLLRYNLKTVRAYLLKEAFQQFCDYHLPTWDGKLLNEWGRRHRTVRSLIEPEPTHEFF